MQPETHKVQLSLDTFCGAKEKTLEDVWEVSQIENVVELYGSWQESGGYFLVQLEGTCHYSLSAPMDLIVEVIIDDMLG